MRKWNVYFVAPNQHPAKRIKLCQISMKKMQEVMHEVYGSDDEYIKELLREGGFNALWNIEFEEVKDN